MFLIKWFILKIRVLKNCIKETQEKLFSVSFLKGIFFILGLLILFFFLIYMFDFATKKQIPAFDFACALLSFSLSVFLPLVTYSAIICGLSFLFQKEEIAFYFHLPIKRTQVFLVKFWQIFLHTIWMVFLGYLTFLVAIKNYFRVPYLIYLNGIIGSLIFFLIPVCLAVIIVIVVSRFFPFVRVKGILTLIGLLVSSVIVLIIRLIEPERLATAQGKIRFLTFMEDLHKPWMTVLPSEWLTNILVSFYRKDLGGISINFIFLFSLALVLFIFTYILAKTFYVKIWSDSLAVPEIVTKKSGWQMFLKIFPSSLQPIIKKDLLSFYRDIVERGSLLILIPLSAIYFFSLYVLNRNSKILGELFSFLYLYSFNLFYSAAVLCGLCGRWVLPSISSEGKNFNLIRISNTSLEEFLQAKFWLGVLPLMVLAQILGIGSGIMLGWSAAYIVLTAFVEIILALGVTLIALILGARLADFSIKEPLEFALSYQGFVYIVWSQIFIVIFVALVSLPLFFFLSKGISPSFIFSSLISVIIASLIFYRIYRAYKDVILYLKKVEVLQ